MSSQKGAENTKRFSIYFDILFEINKTSSNHNLVDLVDDRSLYKVNLNLNITYFEKLLRATVGKKALFCSKICNF
jgi:hypothetical protein